MVYENDALLVSNRDGDPASPSNRHKRMHDPGRQGSPTLPALSTNSLENQYADEFRQFDYSTTIHPLVDPSVTTSRHIDEPSQSLKRVKESISGRSRLSTSLEIIRGWRWELFTWLLGTTSFLIILILLLCFNDMPLSSWKSKVQITAMIAVFSQVSQSAFLVPVSYCTGQLKWKWFQSKDRPMYDIELFDLASRGPDGSMRLLYRLSWRLQLVTLGAVLTILLLGFPTFIQQSVKVATKDIPITGASVLLARANTYEGKGMAYDHTGIATGFRKSNDYIKNAIDRGMVQERVQATEVTGTCPAERCIWPPYSTLAVCSVVEDVSTLLWPGNDHEGSAYTGNMSLRGIMPNTWETDSTLRSATFAYVMEGDEYNMTQHGHQTPPNANGRIQDIAQVFIWYFDPCLKKNSGSQQNLRNVTYWRAFKASFKLCLQTYESSLGPTMESNLLPSENDNMWEIMTSDYYLVQYTPKESSDVFSINQGYLAEIGGQIASTFNISLSDVPNSDYTTYTPWAEQLAEETIPKWNFSLNECIGAELDGFSRRVGNVAMSLTNAFRTSEQSTNVSGIAFTKSSYITVNFIWLVYPAIFFVMTTVFLFATVVQTCNTPLWKSSTIALLYSRAADNEERSANVRQNMAKKVALRLEDVGERHRLVDIDKASREA